MGRGGATRPPPNAASAPISAHAFRPSTPFPYSQPTPQHLSCLGQAPVGGVRAALAAVVRVGRLLLFPQKL